jgi:hypothetical protein
MLNNTSEYYKTIKATYEIYPDGDCFDTHTPFVINKEKMLKIFEKYPVGCRGSKRTLYCIENGIE